jgi:hypothetical protein
MRRRPSKTVGVPNLWVKALNLKQPTQMAIPLPKNLTVPKQLVAAMCVPLCELQKAQTGTFLRS